MTQKVTGLALCALLFALNVSTQAQQPKKVPRIGYLSAPDSATESARAEGMRQALRERGYIEGQTIAIEYRYSDGKVERAPDVTYRMGRLAVITNLANIFTSSSDSRSRTGGCFPETDRLIRSVLANNGLHGSPSRRSAFCGCNGHDSRRRKLLYNSRQRMERRASIDLQYGDRQPIYST